MKIVGGSARGRIIEAPPGRNTRPTSAVLREALFGILSGTVPQARVLDLFSGSGGIGIEALSRGAKQAVLVEFGKEALECIRKNLEKTKLKDRAVVLPVEVTYGVSKLEKMGQVFDLVYADPPYKMGFEPKILSILAASSIVKKGTKVILETSLDTEPDYIDESRYELLKVKKYKTNQHVFLQVKE